MVVLVMGDGPVGAGMRHPDQQRMGLEACQQNGEIG